MDSVSPACSRISVTARSQHCKILKFLGIGEQVEVEEERSTSEQTGKDIVS